MVAGQQSGESRMGKFATVASWGGAGGFIDRPRGKVLCLDPRDG